MKSNLIRGAIRALGVGAVMFTPIAGMAHAANVTLSLTGPNSLFQTTDTLTNAFTNLESLNALLANNFGVTVNNAGPVIAGNTTVSGLSGFQVPVNASFAVGNAANNDSSVSDPTMAMWPTVLPDTITATGTGPNSAATITDNDVNSITDTVSKTAAATTNVGLNIMNGGPIITNNTSVSGSDAGAGTGVTVSGMVANSMNNGSLPTFTMAGTSTGGDTVNVTGTGPSSVLTDTHTVHNTITSAAILNATANTNENINVTNGPAVITGNTSVLNVPLSAPINIQFGSVSSLNNM